MATVQRIPKTTNVDRTITITTTPARLSNDLNPASATVRAVREALKIGSNQSIAADDTRFGAPVDVKINDTPTVENEYQIVVNEREARMLTLLLAQANGNSLSELWSALAAAQDLRYDALDRKNWNQEWFREGEATGFLRSADVFSLERNLEARNLIPAQK